jgi:hypothetical protein
VSRLLYWRKKGERGTQELGALTSELRVRVLNGSAKGCLVESSRPLTIGMIAGLRVNLLGREYDDQVRVTRCQPIAGAGSIFHIAVEFFSTTPPYTGSLRYAIHRQLGQLAGWLHDEATTADQSRDDSGCGKTGADE